MPNEITKFGRESNLLIGEKIKKIFKLWRGLNARI
jgi:hypothetical protein